MTEQVPPEGPEAAEDVPDPSTSTDDEPTTGVPEVDRVLADLDHLHELPLEEHLGAFEQAHGSLRAALDAEPDSPA